MATKASSSFHQQGFHVFGAMPGSSFDGSTCKVSLALAGLSCHAVAFSHALMVALKVTTSERSTVSLCLTGYWNSLEASSRSNGWSWLVIDWLLFQLCNQQQQPMPIESSHSKLTLVKPSLALRGGRRNNGQSLRNLAVRTE